MKREIKFRAWLQDEETMVYSNNQASTDSCEIWMFGDESLKVQVLGTIWREGGGETFESIEYVDCIHNIMQFTGLTDKNGKEIYEGDILKRRYYPLGSDRKIIEYYEIGVVVYGSPSFGLQLKFEGTNVLDEAKKLSHHRTKKQVYKHSSAGENWIDKSFDGDIEIIGNVYENPNILSND